MGFDIAFFFCGKFNEQSITSYIDYAKHYFPDYCPDSIRNEWLNNHFIGLKVTKICAQEEIRFILNVFDLISQDSAAGDYLSSKNWHSPPDISQNNDNVFDNDNFDMTGLLLTIKQQIKTFKEDAELHHHSVYNPPLYSSNDQKNKYFFLQ